MSKPHRSEPAAHLRDARPSAERVLEPRAPRRFPSIWWMMATFARAAIPCMLIWWFVTPPRAPTSLWYEFRDADGCWRGIPIPHSDPPVEVSHGWDGSPPITSWLKFRHHDGPFASATWFEGADVRPNRDDVGSVPSIWFPAAIRYTVDSPLQRLVDAWTPPGSEFSHLGRRMGYYATRGPYVVEPAHTVIFEPRVELDGQTVYAEFTRVESEVTASLYDWLMDVWDDRF